MAGDRTVVWRAIADFASVSREARNAERALRNLERQEQSLAANAQSSSASTVQADTRAGRSATDRANQRNRAAQQDTQAARTTSAASNLISQALENESRASVAAAAALERVRAAAAAQATATQQGAQATQQSAQAHQEHSNAAQADSQATHASAQANQEQASSSQASAQATRDSAQAHQEHSSAAQADAQATRENATASREHASSMQEGATAHREAASATREHTSATQENAAANDQAGQSSSRLMQYLQGISEAYRTNAESSRSLTQARQAEAAASQNVENAVTREAATRERATAATIRHQQASEQLSRAQRTLAEAESAAARASDDDTRARTALETAQNRVATATARVASSHASALTATRNHTNAVSQLEAAQNSLASASSNVARATESASGGAGGLSGVLGSLMGAASGGASSVGTLVLQAQTLGAAVANGVPLVTALAGAVVSLAGAVGPAVGALAAIPNAIAGIGTVIGTVKGAFSGIGEALKAQSKAQDATASSASSSAKAQKAAAEGVQRAQESLKDARANAAQGAVQAAKRVSEAEQSAAENVKSATERVTAAKEAAAERNKSAQERLASTIKDVAERNKAAEETYAETVKNVAERNKAAQESYAETVQSVSERNKAAHEAYLQTVENVAERNKAAEENLANVVESVAERNKAAQESVVRARESAAQSIANANDNVAQAEKALTDAQKNSQRAQQDLNQARQDAVQYLKNMQKAVRDSSFSEEEAAISLEEARRNLAKVRNDPKADELARRKADLDYREAVARLSDARSRKADAIKENADAQKKGIAGSDIMVSAQDKATKAAETAAQAQQNLAKAQAAQAKAITDAAKQIAAAQAAAAKTSLDGAKQVAAAEVAKAKAAADGAKAIAQARENEVKTATAGAKAIADADAARRKTAESGAKAISDAAKARDKTAIDGAKAVADATKSRDDAATSGAKSVADAEKARQKAIEDGAKSIAAAKDAQKQQQVNAAKSIKSAEDGLARALESQKEAYTKASSGADSYSQALAKLTPQQRQFVQFLVGLKPKLEELKRVAAAGLLPGVQSGLQALLPYFPMIRNAVADTASSLGNMMQTFGRTMASKENMGVMSQVFATNKGVLKNMENSVGPLTNAMMRLIGAAQPLVSWFGRLSESFAHWADNSTKAAQSNGGMATFFEHTKTALASTGELFKQLGRIMWGIGKASGDVGRSLLGGIVSATTRLADSVNSVDGQNKLRKWFQEIKPLAESVGRFLAKIGQAVLGLSGGKSGQTAIDSLTKMFDNMSKNGGAVDKVAAALKNLQNARIPEKLGETVNHIADAIGKLTENGGGGLFSHTLDSLNFMIDTLSKVLDLPGVPGILSGIATALGAIAAVKIAGKVTGISQTIDAVKKVKEKNSAENSRRQRAAADAGTPDDWTPTALTRATRPVTNRTSRLRNRVTRDTRSAASTTTTAVRNSAASASSTGRDVARGFTQGVTSAANSVATSARNFANRFLNAIRSIFQIHSPSRTMRTIGDQVGQGFVNGVRDALDDVRRAAQSVKRTVDDTLDNTSTKVRQAGKDTADAYADGVRSGGKSSGHGKGSSSSSNDGSDSSDGIDVSDMIDGLGDDSGSDKDKKKKGKGKRKGKKKKGKGGKGISGLLGGLGGLGGVVLSVMEILGPIGEALAALGGTFATVGEVIAGVAGGPVTLILGALTALYAFCPPFQQFIDQMWSDIGNVISTVWSTWIQPALAAFGAFIWNNLTAAMTWLWQNVMIPAWNGIATAVSWAWNSIIAPALNAMWGFVQNSLIPAMTWLWQNVMIPAWNGIAAAVSWAWNSAISPALSAMWGFLQSVLVPVFNLCWTVAKAVFSGIATTISWAWNTIIKPVLGLMWTFISTILIPVFSALWSAVKTVWGWIGTAISVAWNSVIRPVVQAIVDFFGRWLKPAFDQLWNKVRDVWGWIKGAISAAWNVVIRPTLDGLIGFFNKWLKPAFDQLWNKVRDVWGWIKGAITGAWNNVIRPTLDGLIGFFNKWLKPAFGQLWDKVRDVWNWIKGAISNAWSKAIKPTLDAVIGFFNKWLKPAFGQVWDKVRKVWDDISGKTSQTWGAVKGGLTTFKNWLTSKFVEAFDNAKRSIVKIWDGLRDAVKKPIEFVWNNVIVHGLIDKYNWIADKLHAPQIKGVKELHLASGGRVPGSSPHARADNIPAMLTAGEWVQPVSAVQHYGPRFMEAIRTRKLPKDSIEQWASGGLAGSDEHKKRRRDRMDKDGGNPSNPRRRQFLRDGGQVAATAPAVPTNNSGFSLASIALPSATKADADGVTRLGKGGFPEEGSSVSWQSGIIKRKFPDANISSGFRKNSIVAGSGLPSRHSVGRAVDITASPSRMNEIAGWIAANKDLMSITYDLLYSPRWGSRGYYQNGWFPQNSITVGNHYSHVHWGTWTKHEMKGKSKGFFSKVTDALGDAGGFVMSGIDWLKDKLGDVPKALLEKAVNPLLGKIPGVNSMLGQMLKGIPGTFVDAAVDIFTKFGDDKAAEEGGGDPGQIPNYAGGGNFDKWWDEAIKVAGSSYSQYKNAAKVLAFHESGFNPNAVNRTDSNAKRGTPSAGLMQFIKPTFDTWKWPGHSSWMNPVDQILAFFRYAQGQYGGVYKVPGIASLMHGGKYKPYAEGGQVSGHGNVDSVKAMLMPGEFVMRREAVRRIGVQNLHALNNVDRPGRGTFAAKSQMGVQKFANGGQVAPSGPVNSIKPGNARARGWGWKLIRQLFNLPINGVGFDRSGQQDGWTNDLTAAYAKGGYKIPSPDSIPSAGSPNLPQLVKWMNSFASSARSTVKKVAKTRWVRGLRNRWVKQTTYSDGPTITVKEMQRIVGTAADGIVGAKTKTALRRYKAQHELKSNPKNEFDSTTQRFMSMDSYPNRWSFPALPRLWRAANNAKKSMMAVAPWFQGDNASKISKRVPAILRGKILWDAANLTGAKTSDSEYGGDATPKSSTTSILQSWIKSLQRLIGAPETGEWGTPSDSTSGVDSKTVDMSAAIKYVMDKGLGRQTDGIFPPWWELDPLQESIQNLDKSNRDQAEFLKSLDTLSSWGLTSLVEDLQSKGVDTGLGIARSALQNRTLAAQYDKQLKDKARLDATGTEDYTKFVATVQAPGEQMGIRRLAQTLGMADFAVVDMWKKLLQAGRLKAGGERTAALERDVRLFDRGVFYANTGGRVPGVGDGDTVPAMLTPGEFVLRKAAVKAIGLDNLYRMNAQQFATGGPVYSMANVGNGDMGAAAIRGMATPVYRPAGDTTNVSNTYVTINNPVRERSTRSVNKALRQQAVLKGDTIGADSTTVNGG